VFCLLFADFATNTLLLVLQPITQRHLAAFNIEFLTQIVTLDFSLKCIAKMRSIIVNRIVINKTKSLSEIFSDEGSGKTSTPFSKVRWQTSARCAALERSIRIASALMRRARASCPNASVAPVRFPVQGRQIQAALCSDSFRNCKTGGQATSSLAPTARLWMFGGRIFAVSEWGFCFSRQHLIYLNLFVITG